MAGESWYEDDELWETIEPYIFCRSTLEKTSAQVDAIVSWSGVSPPAAILDICCGAGRHSLEFARRGYDVTGVDRTARFLDRARAGAEAEGLGVEYICADVREFSRHDSFDVALNLSTSFGYFSHRDDDRKVLEKTYNSLLDGGFLVIDLMGKEVLARIFKKRHEEEEDGIKIIQEGNITGNWEWIESRWEVVRDGLSLAIEVAHRLYSAVELTDLLCDCGFTVLHVFGGFEGVPYDERAQRLIVVAAKRMR